LAPHLNSLPDRAIEKIVSSQGLEPFAAEDFFSDLGNIVSSALPVIGGAIGSIVAPGVGTAIGSGLGSLAGGALHAAIGSGQQPAPQPSASPPPQPQQYGAYAYPPQGYPYPPQTQPYYPYPAPAGSFPQQASSQQSVAQLLQLLMQPQLLQALAQMLLGRAGSPTVAVPVAPASNGNIQGLLSSLLGGALSGGLGAGGLGTGGLGTGAGIPVSAFTNALGALATQASEAYNAERAMSSVDHASPESRAQALIETLQASGDAAAAHARRKRKRRLATLAQAFQMVDDRRGAALSS
jgi:hypothetical protein